MRPFFKKCGRGFKVATNVTINHPERIEIGDNVYFAHGVWLNGFGGLKFGSNIQLGPYCVIVTSKHLYKKGEVTNTSIPSSVEIKSGVWLASHVVVRDGVTINNGVTIGANSTVTQDIPQKAIAVGSPAVVKKIRE